MRTVHQALLIYESDEHCRVCSGVLIGSEKRYGTCGHCGGRSLSGWKDGTTRKADRRRLWQN